MDKDTKAKLVEALLDDSDNKGANIENNIDISLGKFHPSIIDPVPEHMGSASLVHTTGSWKDIGLRIEYWSTVKGNFVYWIEDDAIIRSYFPEKNIAENAEISNIIKKIANDPELPEEKKPALYVSNRVATTEII